MGEGEVRWWKLLKSTNLKRLGVEEEKNGLYPFVGNITKRNVNISCSWGQEGDWEEARLMVCEGAWLCVFAGRSEPKSQIERDIEVKK